MHFVVLIRRSENMVVDSNIRTFYLPSKYALSLNEYMIYSSKYYAFSNIIIIIIMIIIMLN